uniref:Metalloendopeptidase n=1 Tax=Parastrongyloides trichosuri TaxID=131310 RepID=A0A0N4ZTV3_PARTI
CLSFIESTIKFTDKPGIIFSFGTNCSSIVGYDQSNSPQTIFLTHDCTESFGIVQHELGHALGLGHEHSRADRDFYIKILKENIQSGESMKSIIDKDENNYNTLGIYYDYSSIMHYHKKAFSNNGKDTIKVKQISPYNDMIGQREKMSFSDIHLINKHYCKRNCEFSDWKCKNGGYLHWSSCSRCICPRGYYGSHCEFVKYHSNKCSSPVELTAFDNVSGISEVGIKNCNYRIRTENGKKIYVLVFVMNTLKKAICSPGYGIEIKYVEDKGVTGLCLCGIYTNIEIISQMEEVFIEYNGMMKYDAFLIKYSIAKGTYPNEVTCYNNICYESYGVIYNGTKINFDT